MKLFSAVFSGLPGAKQPIKIECDDVNVFVGPNGAGKSTVLKILKFSLDLLARKTVGGLIGEVENWLVFETAELIFKGGSQSFSHFLPDLLDTCTDELLVKIRCQDGRFYIEDIESGSKVAVLLARPKEEIDDFQSACHETQRRIDEIEHHLNTSSNNANNANLRQEQSQLREQLKIQIISYEASMQCEIIKPGTFTEDIGREVLDSALAKSNFPAAIMVDSEKAIDDAIPKLIEKMCLLKAGKRLDNKRYKAAHIQLQHLLQHEVDFYEKDDERYLTVNGVDYRKASSGTRVTLAYFGLTDLLAATDIVIWDEPENGLHPTRRIRVLDLIQADPRQFFIATHALEFAPIFAPKGTIFRCDSHYEDDAEYPTLSVRQINGRSEGFLLLEALGVQPARTLFTANVVIWVEGPTELVFYRHWLKKVLQPKGLEEGFHYTIMHYGGGLISYLGVADPEHMQQAFDALSICRNLIVIVDSDLRAAVDGEIHEHLKSGARRVKEQIDSLNATRPGSALFSATAGREIENYLPPRVLLHAASKCWQGYEAYKENLVVDKFRFGQYDSFEDALEDFLVDSGVTKRVVKDKAEHDVVIGKSRWGAVNKVEMMRAALTIEELEPTDLLWGFADELSKIVDFVIQASEA